MTKDDDHSHIDLSLGISLLKHQNFYVENIYKIN